MTDRSRNARFWLKILPWAITAFSLLAVVAFLLKSDDQADFFFALGGILLIGTWTLLITRRIHIQTREYRHWLDIAAVAAVVTAIAIGRHLWSHAFDGHRVSTNMVLAYVCLLVVVVGFSHLAILFGDELLFRRRTSKQPTEAPAGDQSSRAHELSWGVLLSRVAGRVVLPLVVAGLLLTLTEDTVDVWFGVSAVALVPAWVFLFGKIHSMVTGPKAAATPTPHGMGLPTMLGSAALFPLARYTWWLSFQRDQAFDSRSLMWLAIMGFYMFYAATSAKEVHRDWQQRTRMQQS